jgi:hypothetical protein
MSAAHCAVQATKRYRFFLRKRRPGASPLVNSTPARGGARRKSAFCHDYNQSFICSIYKLGL